MPHNSSASLGHLGDEGTRQYVCTCVHNTYIDYSLITTDYKQGILTSHASTTADYKQGILTSHASTTADYKQGILTSHASTTADYKQGILTSCANVTTADYKQGILTCCASTTTDRNKAYWLLVLQPPLTETPQQKVKPEMFLNQLSDMTFSSAWKGNA